jgi:hypothetical protein
MPNRAAKINGNPDRRRPRQCSARSQSNPESSGWASPRQSLRAFFLGIRIDGTAGNAHDAIDFRALTLVRESCSQANYPGLFQHIRARRASSRPTSSGIGGLEHVMRMHATARESWSSPSIGPASPSPCSVRMPTLVCILTHEGCESGVGHPLHSALFPSWADTSQTRALNSARWRKSESGEAQHRSTACFDESDDVFARRLGR